MPGETYSGPYFGNRTVLVFDSDGNYLNKNLLSFTADSVFLAASGLTTDYAQNGGITVGTNRELREFISSRFFADTNSRRNFIQTGEKSPSIKNSTKFATTVAKSKLGATLAPENRTISQIDPRSTHFLYIAATAGYFTAEHMDEIQIKTTTGLTLQGYFGGSLDNVGTGGVSGGFTFGFYLLGVGRTFGVTGATGFLDITAGNSLENMNNGITTTLVANPFLGPDPLVPNIARTIVQFNDFRTDVLQQMPATVSSDVTSTFNVSGGTVTYQVNASLLNTLQRFQTLIEANHKVYATADAAFISEIVVPGISGGTFPLSVTSGGSATADAHPFTGFTGASEFDMILNDAFTRALNTTIPSKFDKISAFTTVRELEQIDFLSL